MKISAPMIKKQLRKMPNWKNPGPDGMHGYWLKKFTALHEKIATHLNECLRSVPEWLTEGRTVLVLKDKGKEGEVSNFRPITCLSLMWKLFKGVLTDTIYEHLERKSLLPEEQKGCRRNLRGTKDQLLTDMMILKNCRRRKTGLRMAWVDYKKAYDMVPHSWMNMFGSAENLTGVVQNSMTQWKTELTAGNQVLGEVCIKRGIFQWDSLSPLLSVLALIPLTLMSRKVKAGYSLGNGLPTINHLLFMDDLKLYGKSENQVDTLLQSVRIVSEDIRMEFGIEKCAVLVMKRGKLVKSEGIVIPGERLIRAMNDGDVDAYKYLGVLEGDEIKHTKMKRRIKKECFRRVRNILKSKLNGWNMVQAITCRVVAVVQ